MVRRHISPYPKGDVRYVQSPDEQVEGSKAVTLDDIRKFYSRFYGASNSEFVVRASSMLPKSISLRPTCSATGRARLLTSVSSLPTERLKQSTGTSKRPIRRMPCSSRRTGSR